MTEQGIELLTGHGDGMGCARDRKDKSDNPPHGNSSQNDINASAAQSSITGRARITRTAMSRWRHKSADPVVLEREMAGESALDQVLQRIRQREPVAIGERASEVLARARRERESV